MTIRARDVLIIFAVGLIIGWFTSSIIGEKELDKVKQQSDSLATEWAARDSSKDVFIDSMQAVVDSVNKKKNKVIRVAVSDSQLVAKLDTALAESQTKDDSIAVLTEQNFVLKRENISLWEALAIDTVIQNNQQKVIDSLNTLLTKANQDIQTLNRDIQGLRPKLPKLVRYGFEAAKIGGAFWLGTQVKKK